MLNILQTIINIFAIIGFFVVLMSCFMAYLIHVEGKKTKITPFNGGFTAQYKENHMKNCRCFIANGLIEGDK